MILRKFLSVFIFSFFIFQFLFSQQPIQKGNFIVGGSGSFNTSSSNLTVTQDDATQEKDGPVTTSLSLNPSIGYFISNNFALGVSANYSLQRTNIDDTRTSDASFLAGPMARFYMPIGENKAGFIHLGSGFGTSNDDITLDGENVQSNTNFSRFSIGPGLTLFSSKQVGVEILGLYNFNRSNNNVTGELSNTQTISRTQELEVRLGIQWYLSVNN